jgi:hypothetical protein
VPCALDVKYSTAMLMGPNSAGYYVTNLELEIPVNGKNIVKMMLVPWELK